MINEKHMDTVHQRHIAASYREQAFFAKPRLSQDTLGCDFARNRWRASWREGWGRVEPLN
jgi:hypothetical protein